MTSLRQIDANRRNAQRSTGPVSEEGKRKSRRNAVRHGLTAETVIGTLEDAKDYAAFEMAVTAGYDAPTAVERELVLRLASLLWRLRRATAIESGLFNIQVRNLFEFRKQPQARRRRQILIDNVYQLALTPEASERHKDCYPNRLETDCSLNTIAARQAHNLTLSFVRLANQPTYPLDRLSRYEATLWRQTYQIIATLRYFRSRLT
jgi:hypothetical protein